MHAWLCVLNALALCGEHAWLLVDDDEDGTSTARARDTLQPCNRWNVQMQRRLASPRRRMDSARASSWTTTWRDDGTAFA